MDDSRDDSRVNLAAFVAELDSEFGRPDAADVERILRALAEVEVGDVVSHERVVADLADRRDATGSP